MDCSFAAEYLGPPPSYDLPCALPINVEKIPVASVMPQVPLTGTLKLPIVQPISPLDLSSQKFSKDVHSRVPDAHISPTSVIAFDREETSSRELGFSLELDASQPLSLASECSELEVGSSFSSNRVSFRDLSGDVGSSEALEYPEIQEVSSSGSDVLGVSRETNGSSDLSNLSDPIWASKDSIDEGKKSFCCENNGMKASVKKPMTKGTCYRCERGNRFTEKEVCLVCDAKYCSNCVLKAMGSMPEGRKCVSCIGNPIDESKRGQLGKCSRMLRRLLDVLEVHQFMKTEKFCEVNQLPSEYVRVNGKPLSQDELVVLQNCLNPPKKLKPDKYWYDKVSGFWGKEGEKPCQIISPHLNVGGPIETNASNGNTQVFMNGREITKVELRMLQFSGVQCAGNPHFWVNEDGSYQEEGQKNTRGYIWAKTGMKLICAALALPVPSRSPSSKHGPNKIANKAVADYIEERILHKILLVGPTGSGTNTIFKQAKILYQEMPFSMEERETIGTKIQSNLFRHLGILLEARERFEDEHVPSGDGNMYAIIPRLKTFSDWLLRATASGTLEAIFPAASREYAPLVEELWNDPAVRATYARRSELAALPETAGHFLGQVSDVLRTDYVPSDADILNAEGVATPSNGLSFADFSFPRRGTHYYDYYDDDDGDGCGDVLRYQLIQANPSGLGENCKWIEMFEDVRLVILCVSLADYDGDAMPRSRRFFEGVVGHPTFRGTDFLLLLTKFDLFEDAIERRPLSVCDWFTEFRPLPVQRSAGAASLGLLGFHFVAVKFKRLFTALTGRKLYVCLVDGLNRDSVDSAMRYTREIVRWADDQLDGVDDYSERSSYNTDDNTCFE